jgi:hypothetical protein
VTRKIAAILAADVVGDSRLMAEDEEDTMRDSDCAPVSCIAKQARDPRGLLVKWFLCYKYPVTEESR